MEGDGIRGARENARGMDMFNQVGRALTGAGREAETL